MLIPSLLALAGATLAVPVFEQGEQVVLRLSIPSPTSLHKSAPSTINLDIDHARSIGQGTGKCKAGERVLELGPDDIRCAVENEKWFLKRIGTPFFDITNVLRRLEHFDQPLHVSSEGLNKAIDVSLPDAPTHMDAVKPLLKHIDIQFMKEHLYTLTMFHNRYYKSQSGLEASMWLFYTVWRELEVPGTCDKGATMHIVQHAFEQKSLIARIPGRTNKTIIVGAHLDCLNLLDFSARSPGADDNGSGAISALEAMRAILHDPELVNGEQENTLEFHFYAANEGGFLGSLDIYQEYARTGRDVRAMLNLDMTGWTRSSLEAGAGKHIGLVEDYVHLGLTNFTKQLVETYLDVPWKTGRAGWAASDYSSAHKYGFPSAGAKEALPKWLSPHSLAESDTLETIDFSQMRELSKLAVAFAYELMNAEL